MLQSTESLRSGLVVVFNGLKLIERGPKMEAVVDVFERWIRKYPGDIILEKWVCDALEPTRGKLLLQPEKL